MNFILGMLTFHLYVVILIHDLVEDTLEFVNSFPGYHQWTHHQQPILMLILLSFVDHIQMLPCFVSSIALLLTLSALFRF